MRVATMTLGEIYQQGKGMLFKAGNQNAAFDAVCLFQNAFGLDHQALLIHSNEQADTARTKDYLAQIAELRARGPRHGVGAPSARAPPQPCARR